MNNPFECITGFIFVENEIKSADVILIPGSDYPQLMEKASSLYKQGFAPYILPSGGYKESIKTTEWEYLKQIGIENGVPANVILKEEKAQHTLENARFSFEVLKEKGIQPKKVIIVCKAGHSRRALLCYQTEFPVETEFIVSPVTDRFGITKDNWNLSEIGISRIMSEVEKIGKYYRAILPNSVIHKSY
ncbi:YdcF family protein [Gottfriedia sp. S16(2024)]|uniref:YdcF family protein n=1 Tax=Gottfriedia sp. S16(2024) TaxID=3162883 RepID=UPI003D1DC958